MTEFVSMKFQAERDSLLSLPQSGHKKDSGGETMKHFTTVEWIDFVNQVISPSAWMKWRII